MEPEPSGNLTEQERNDRLIAELIQAEQNECSAKQTNANIETSFFLSGRQKEENSESDDNEDDVWGGPVHEQSCQKSVDR